MKLLQYSAFLLFCIQIHLATSGRILNGIANKVHEDLHSERNKTTALNGELDLGFVTLTGDLTVNKQTALDKESADGNTDLNFEKEKKVDVNFGIKGKPIIHNLLHPDDQIEYNKTIGLSSDRTTSLHVGSKLGSKLHDIAERIPRV